MPQDRLEAILLVGGQGTRLRPLTISVPKPLLPVGGAPLLHHQLARAAAAGVTHVVLATSYRAEMFADSIGDGNRFGLSVEYVEEPTPLGTAGGIRNAASRLRSGADEPVVVLNGDILSGHDLAAQVDLHRKTKAAATLHLVEVDDPTRFGCVPTDATGRVTAFLEKTPTPVTRQVNAGCYVLTRQVIERIPPNRPVSVERETFPALIAAGELVMGYRESAYWLDVGTPETLVRGSCDLVLGKLATSASPRYDGGERAATGRASTPPGAALLLPGAVVADGAVVSGGSVVGSGGIVEARAVVDGSLLFDGVRVGADAVVQASVVGRDAWIGPGAVLDGAVIGDGARIGSGNELARGMRVWPGVRLGPTAVRFSPDV